MTLINVEAEALVTKPKPGYLYYNHLQKKSTIRGCIGYKVGALLNQETEAKARAFENHEAEAEARLPKIQEAEAEASAHVW